MHFLTVDARLTHTPQSGTARPMGAAALLGRKRTTLQARLRGRGAHHPA